MLSRLHSTLLSSLILVGAACGDDKGGTATETTSTTADTTTDAPTTGAPTTGTPTTSGVTTDDTTTTGTPTTGEPTTGPGTTTGMMGGCNAPADDADEDSDNVPNNADNCRCDFNPNQLDFDGNAVGNVCDAPLSFTIADGVPPEFNSLATQAQAKQAIAMCQFPVNMIVTGGDVQVTLDDEGTAKVWAAQVNVADTPDLTCEIPLIVTVKLAIEMLVITGPDQFAVGFPFAIGDHDAGTVTGMMDMIHNIVVNGIINVKESSNEQLAMTGATPLMDVAGSFPAGMVTVVNAGEQITIDFNNNNHVVFQMTTEGGLEVTLTGLTGKLRLKK